MSEFIRRKLLRDLKHATDLAIKEVAKTSWLCKDVIIAVLDEFYRNAEKSQCVFRRHDYSIIDDTFIIMVWSYTTHNWEIYSAISEHSDHLDIVPVKDATVKSMMASIPVDLKDDIRFITIADTYRYLMKFSYRLMKTPRMVNGYHVSEWHSRNNTVSVYVAKNILEELNSDPGCLQTEKLFVDSITEEE